MFLVGFELVVDVIVVVLIGVLVSSSCMVISRFVACRFVVKTSFNGDLVNFVRVFCCCCCT